MRKFRGMSEKHIALGKWYALRQSNTSAVNLKLWSEDYPEWSYDEDVTHFGRDCRSALENIKERYAHAKRMAARWEVESLKWRT